MTHALGLLETTGFTPAIAALDVMEKAAAIEVVQAELNDLLGVCLKIAGSLDKVRTAIEAGHRTAHDMGGRPASNVIARPEPRAEPALTAAAEFNPLIQQDVVIMPKRATSSASRARTSEPPFALGLIETQGFTAVFEAVDTACKTAGVEVIGKEKLGGGYVTVVIKGDVAAVKAAIAAGQQKVEGLGKLIAAHVIARPSESVLSLLPQ